MLMKPSHIENLTDYLNLSEKLEKSKRCVIYAGVPGNSYELCYDNVTVNIREFMSHQSFDRIFIVFITFYNANGRPIENIHITNINSWFQLKMLDDWTFILLDNEKTPKNNKFCMKKFPMGNFILNNSTIFQV